MYNILYCKKIVWSGVVSEHDEIIGDNGAIFWNFFFFFEVLLLVEGLARTDMEQYLRVPMYFFFYPRHVARRYVR